MPIHGITDRPRFPRLGKVRLGEKRVHQPSGYSYPVATPYFVLKDAPGVAEVYGEKPTELSPIILPSEAEELFAPSSYKLYTQTWGATCVGDGRSASRLVDTLKLQEAGGSIEAPLPPADRDTKKAVRINVPCPCPLLDKGGCRAVMSLMFLLPKVSPFGVFQVDTGSTNSIRSIFGSITTIRWMVGRISGIPLRLRLVEQETVTMGDDKVKGGKKKIHVLDLSTIPGMDLETLKSFAERLSGAQHLALPSPEVEDVVPPGDFSDYYPVGDKPPEPSKPQEQPNQPVTGTPNPATQGKPQRGAAKKAAEPATEAPKKDYTRVYDWARKHELVVPHHVEIALRMTLPKYFAQGHSEEEAIAVLEGYIQERDAKAQRSQDSLPDPAAEPPLYDPENPPDLYDGDPNSTKIEDVE